LWQHAERQRQYGTTSQCKSPNGFWDIIGRLRGTYIYLPGGQKEKEKLIMKILRN